MWNNSYHFIDLKSNNCRKQVSWIFNSYINAALAEVGDSSRVLIYQTALFNSDMHKYAELHVEYDSLMSKDLQFI